MGNTYLPKYRVEYKTQTGLQSCSWDIKSHGRPTEKNAEAFRISMNLSFLTGGTNAHLADSKNGVPHVSSVRIVNQRTGRTACMVTAPMFEIVE